LTRSPPEDRLHWPYRQQTCTMTGTRSRLKQESLENQFAAPFSANHGAD
jgi:hypothetical protein